MSALQSSPPKESSTSLAPDAAVVRWLIGVYLSILVMVMIGGTTRLTGSGLSMVQWHPLMGVLPPLTEEQWHEVFSRYQLSPQFTQVNHWMDLQAFKKIFFWEYLHRLMGRLIGLIVVLPAFYFWRRGRLTRHISRLTVGAVILGGSQGVLGWYMVKSGLSDVPEVSHLRLAAHLGLAFVVSQWVLWMVLELIAPSKRDSPPLWGGRRLPILLLAVLHIQIMYGAFVAGKRAGLLAPTFPDMNGHYLPFSFFTPADFLKQLIENPLVIHYIHRSGALVLVLGISFVSIQLLRNSRRAYDQFLARLLMGLVLLQGSLGAMTVVSLVSIPWAVAHQAGAFLLLGAVTALLHRAFRTS